MTDKEKAKKLLDGYKVFEVYSTIDVRYESKVNVWAKDDKEAWSIASDIFNDGDCTVDYVLSEDGEPYTRITEKNIDEVDEVI